MIPIRTTRVVASLRSTMFWCLMLLTTSTSAANSADSSWESLDGVIPSDMNGCVMVRDAGQVLLQHSFGVRREGGPELCDALTNFRLASISKQFTATAVMCLVERGTLSLDDPLTRFFPGFPPYGHDILIRHLLTHTSGLPDYEPLIPQGTELQLSDQNVLQILMNQNAGDFPPGAGFHYSNSGYVLLGLVVEVAAKCPYHQFVQESVFEPLGMSNSRVYLRGMNEVPARAYGHADQANAWIVEDQSLTSALRGDGSVYSSLRDLDRWLTSLENRSLLKSDSYNRMWTPHVRTDRGEQDYGFGWFLDSYGGERRISHNGSSRGFRHTMHWYPTRRAAVVLLSNREVTWPTARVCEQIADATIFLSSSTPRSNSN